MDDIRFTAVEAGVLSNGASLSLTGSSPAFDPGPATVSLGSLAGVAGSIVNLSNTSLVITRNDHTATFAGTLTGTGSLTVTGTLRLVGDAVLDFTGPFTNTGVLDIMTWNGTLPAGFVNHGVVLDHSKVKIDSFEKSGDTFALTIAGVSGHRYQPQRTTGLSGAWENVGTAQSGDNTLNTFTDSAANSVIRRFYRVMLNP